jgi:hypothetical protein
VGHPAAVLLIVVIVGGTAAAPISAQIVDIVIPIRESELLAQLITSRHARLQRIM